MGSIKLLLTQDPSRRISQQQTDYRGYQSDTNRVDKCINRLGMNHKLTEIGEGKHSLVVRKSVIHDQQERYHDKNGQENHIWNRPIPSS